MAERARLREEARAARAREVADRKERQQIEGDRKAAERAAAQVERDRAKAEREAEAVARREQQRLEAERKAAARERKPDIRTYCLEFRTEAGPRTSREAAPWPIDLAAAMRDYLARGG